jgi:uncharacterized surface anchored protein
MKLLKSLAFVVSLGLLLTASYARADEYDKLTKVTFSGPVQVENTQLPAGTYTFKLMDDEGDRNIVQIFNADQTHLIATILAMPDYRLKATGKTVVKFSETRGESQAEGNIPDNGIAIKEWFYPGNSFGREFRVMPAQQVASAQPQPAPVAEAAPAPAPVAAAPAAEPAQTAPDAAPAAAAPSNEQPAPAAAAPADQQTSNQPAQLPQTASELPLMALIGMLSLAGAASLRVILKMTA